MCVGLDGRAGRSNRSIIGTTRCMCGAPQRRRGGPGRRRSRRRSSPRSSRTPGSSPAPWLFFGGLGCVCFGKGDVDEPMCCVRHACMLTRPTTAHKSTKHNKTPSPSTDQPTTPSITKPNNRFTNLARSLPVPSGRMAILGGEWRQSIESTTSNTRDAVPSPPHTWRMAWRGCGLFWFDFVGGVPVGRSMKATRIHTQATESPTHPHTHIQ